MNFCTPNQNGQITIPIAIRKKNKINANVVFEVYTDNDIICLKPLKGGRQHLNAKLKKCAFVPLVLKGKKKFENVSENIDNILYKK